MPEPSSKEAPPSLSVGPEIEKADNTGHNEEELSDTAGHDQAQNWLAEMACVQEKPELFCSGLKEMRDEQTDVVPGAADEDASAEV